MNEVWSAIPSAPGYEASSIGRVRGADRVVVRTDGRRAHYRPRVLSQRLHHTGYLYVTLGRQSRQVHRLVLEAFQGPAAPGMESCHNNGDPLDNRVSNLRWDTHSANMRDQTTHGRHPMSRRSHCKHGHPLTEVREGQMPNGARRRCVFCWKASVMRRQSPAKWGGWSIQELSDQLFSQQEARR